MSKLHVENVTKEYVTRAEPLVVLRGVSLELSAGQNVAIVGPSGSGKSTLLHVMGALDAPTSGQVELDGQNPYQLSERQLAHFRNANVGFVFQDHHLLPQLNVTDNVLLPAVAEGKPSAALVQRATELVERVGLAQRKSHLPSELSGGEKQRAAVARALLMKPSLILADEPTGSLDGSNAQQIATLLAEMQTAENAMLVVVTHSTELASQMQRTLRFENGKLVG